MIRVGDPGTKSDTITLEDLSATAGFRTGRKHILSIVVENKPGVLTRVAGLFARRGFNIDTLVVGPTDDPTLSRITLTLDGAMHPIDQVTKQLHKLVNVLKIRDLEPDEAVVAYNAACTYVLIGDFERAFDELERVHVEEMANRDWMEQDSALDPVRKHPRYTKLLAMARQARRRWLERSPECQATGSQPKRSAKRLRKGSVSAISGRRTRTWRPRRIASATASK